MLPQLLFPSHSSHNCFIPRASQHCDLNWPVMLRCYPHVRPGGGRGYFLAPWQWFISLHQMENILIESLQLQEQPPQKQRHRKLFRVQIGNLSVVVNNFLSCCSRFVHLWPGQGPGPVTSRCHCRVASPGLFVDCCLEIDVMVLPPGFVFMMFGSEAGPGPSVTGSGQSLMLYPVGDRCAEARERGGGVMVNKWCKT